MSQRESELSNLTISESTSLGDLSPEDLGSEWILALTSCGGPVRENILRHIYLTLYNANAPDLKIQVKEYTDERVVSISVNETNTNVVLVNGERFVEQISFFQKPISEHEQNVQMWWSTKRIESSSILINETDYPYGCHRQTALLLPSEEDGKKRFVRSRTNSVTVHDLETGDCIHRFSENPIHLGYRPMLLLENGDLIYPVDKGTTDNERYPGCVFHLVSGKDEKYTKISEFMVDHMAPTLYAMHQLENGKIVCATATGAFMFEIGDREATPLGEQSQHTQYYCEPGSSRWVYGNSLAVAESMDGNQVLIGAQEYHKVAIYRTEDGVYQGDVDVQTQPISMVVYRSMLFYSTKNGLVAVNLRSNQVTSITNVNVGINQLQQVVIAQKSFPQVSDVVEEATEVNVPSEQETPNRSHYVLFQDIEVGDVIGRGATADVFKGTLNGEEIAVKQFRVVDGGNNLFSTTLLREAEVLNVTHNNNNLVGFKGVSVDQPDHQCILMELATGGTLGSLISLSEPLSPQNVVSIALGIANGMNHLHQKGIIHCDLKPENVLITENGGVKITDFGISKSVQQTRNTLTISMGTWMYGAPEVALVGVYESDSDDEETSSSSSSSSLNNDRPQFDKTIDVFSFGMILWSMMAGKPPYEGRTIEWLIGRWFRDPERRPRIETDWDADIVSLMKQCWKTDPTNRPSFAEIIDSLRSIYNRSEQEISEALREIVFRVNQMTIQSE